MELILSKDFGLRGHASAEGVGCERTDANMRQVRGHADVRITQTNNDICVYVYTVNVFMDNLMLACLILWHSRLPVMSRRTRSGGASSGCLGVWGPRSYLPTGDQRLQYSPRLMQLGTLGVGPISDNPTEINLAEAPGILAMILPFVSTFGLEANVSSL